MSPYDVLVVSVFVFPNLFFQLKNNCMIIPYKMICWQEFKMALALDWQLSIVEGVINFKAK